MPHPYGPNFPLGTHQYIYGFMHQFLNLEQRLYFMISKLFMHTFSFVLGIKVFVIPLYWGAFFAEKQKLW